MLDSPTRNELFPSLGETTYLNTAAEGIPPVTTAVALHRYLEAKTLGMAGRDALFENLASCQAAAARVIGLEPGDVSFCSSTSEAYNLLATALVFAPGDNVVISNLDYPSGATPWLRASGDPEVRLWEAREGVLELADLESMIDERTRLVQVSLVSFLTGYRVEWHPLRDLVRRKNPDAILSADVTQAAGRVDLDCLDADCLFASTYKWLLGIHGGCVVAVPPHGREKIVTRAGGWYHLENAFDADRFSETRSLPGAAGFAVGMPSFPAIYGLQVGLELLEETGVGNIAQHADALVARLHEGLADLGIPTMAPPQPGNSSGIVSFQSSRADAIHAGLLEREIHIMHQAGRLRASVHGYNTREDIDRLIGALAEIR